MKITKAFLNRPTVIVGAGETREVEATAELPIAVVGSWVRIGGHLYFGDLFARLEVDAAATVSRGKAGGAAAGAGTAESAGPSA